jgi:ATP-dependent Clp protease ATP-binding subunit ClpC
MPKFSVGVELAWSVAANEAVRAGYQYVEREHVLIGLCSLEKFPPSNTTNPNLNADALQRLSEETAVVGHVFREAGIEASTVRRWLREQMGASSYSRTEPVIHRSDACRALFHRAGRLAEAASSSEVRCSHLLAAMLEDPGENITTLFAQNGITIENLNRLVEEAMRAGAAPMEDRKSPGAVQEEKVKLNLLSRYGRDLTALAQDGSPCRGSCLL